MQDIKFPVQFKFKVTSLANDFTATDANGHTIAYVRSKLFKFVEDIEIFSDETKSKVLYTIKADQWLDFSAAYSFYDDMDTNFGKVVRKGWRSLWKAKYQIIDEHEKEQYVIEEESAWVRVLDSLLGEIPFISFFTGYLFNPKYNVKDELGNPIIKLTKKPSFLGKSFELTKEGNLDSDDDDRVMLALMMMILLERRRG